MSKKPFAEYRRRWTLSLTTAAAMGERRRYRGIICEAIERKSKLILVSVWPLTILRGTRFICTIRNASFVQK